MTYLYIAYMSLIMFLYVKNEQPVLLLFFFVGNIEKVINTYLRTQKKFIKMTSLRFI